MRIERLQLHGFLRFAGTIALDLRELPPGLIALTGENGAGKTTLLEAAVAALYREFPSRDDQLVDYATGRDSSLELECVMDGRGSFRARVHVDGPKRASEAVLEQILPSGLRTTLNDGKVSTFDDVVRREFPSKALLLASAFAAQNKRGNFLGKTQKENRELFTELIGAQDYLTKSQTAKTIAGAIEAVRGRLRARLEELGRDASDGILAALEMDSDRLARETTDTVARRATLATEIEALDQRLATMQDAVAAFAAASQRIATFRTELAGRRAERAVLEADVQKLGQALASERTRLTKKLETDRAAAVKARDTELADIEKRREGNKQLQDQAAGIRAAVDAIAVNDKAILTLRADVDARQITVEQIGASLRTIERDITALQKPEGELTRARTDAKLLEVVPCGGAGEFAACQLLVNAQQAKLRILELEARIAGRPDLEARLHQHTAELAVEREAVAIRLQQIKALNQQTDVHQALAKYAQPLAAAEARVTELNDRHAAVTTSATERLAQLQHDADAALVDAERRHDQQRVELAERTATLNQTVTRLEGELATAEADLSAHQDQNQRATVAQIALKDARANWDVLVGLIARLEAGRQELERRRREIAEKRARQAGLQARVATLDTELVEWTWLAKALGPGGLPDLEIDAAGPTISALTNELLEVCFGTRFSIELVTQVPKADGKGFKDEFTIHVTDNRDGGEPRDISDLSGGEQVIVSEALMNAIGLYVNTRSPMPIRTAWRDETTGALDPENAVRYLQMLRKVHQLGGYWHIFFVTHNPAVAALADAQIRIADGQAAVVLPPFSEAA